MSIDKETEKVFRMIATLVFKHYYSCDSIENCWVCKIMLQESGKVGLAIAKQSYIQSLKDSRRS